MRFPGWKAAVGMFLIGFFLSGFLAPLVLYVPYITSDGYALTTVSFLFTGQALAALAGNYFIEPLVRRIGLKQTIGVGILVSAAAYLALFAARNGAAFFAAGCLVGLGWAFGTFSPINLLISRWFLTGRERIISVLLSGTILGSGIFTTVQSVWLTRFGWKNSCLLIAVLAVGIDLPLLWLLVRESPAKLGLRRYGENPGDPAPAIKQQKQQTGEGIDPAIACRIPAYYGMVIGFVLIGIGVSGAWSFVADAMQDRGFTALQTGFFVAVTNWSGCLACLGIGFMAERVSTRSLVLALGLIAAVSSLLVANLPPILPAMTVTMVIRSIGSLLNNNGPTYVVMPTFGPRSYEKVFGRLQAMVCLGQAFSALFLGQVAAHFGYRAVYNLAGVSILVGAGAVLAGMRLAEGQKTEERNRNHDRNGENESRTGVLL